MDAEVTLVVSGPSPAAEELCLLLAADGAPVARRTPEQLLAEAPPPTGLLLVNASLDVEVVREVTQVVQAGARPPVVVAFTDGDLRQLEPHVLAGLDYVVPPFVPELLHRRLRAGQVFGRYPGAEGEALLKYERELQIGREIQAGFLPDALPARAGWQLTVRFQPAREVAGDFYDALELLGGSRIGLVVADVCDKGVGAALFMALIRTLLRHTAAHVGAGEPDTVQDDATPLLRAVIATNDYLTANHLRQGYFATLFFGVLDPVTGALVYINCGHNPPIIRHAGGGHTLLRPTGPALGLVPDSVFEVGRAHLDQGDLLFAYTDGVPEARDESGRFFSEELMLTLVSQPATGADDLLDRLEREISAHIGSAEQFDDITMIALRRTPTGKYGQ
ncbi:PP2C family protein-serine/threonine phosphatase [Nonomuraea sp. NPDC001636]|uniref:PP2C family protein-serine/threonine phosphatase n=1 Tax=Nonomuraea sp. NPDC001636 TaxID=3154391 RepID=UPI0033213E4C